MFSGVDFAALAIDPANAAHLYAATTTGLYESQDGGSSWAHPTGTGDFTDASTDVVLDATTGAAYVATAGAGVQVSTDGGTNFTTLGGGLPAPANVAGAAIAVRTATSTNPTGDQSVYAAVALNGATDPNGGQLSLYQSTDGGTTWTRLSVPAYTNQAHAFGSGSADQSTFDNALTVDPANPAHIIVGGISALESSDGGGHWTDLNGQDFFGPGTNVLHPDVHALAFTPAGAVVLGTDGGVFGYDPGTPGPGGVSNLNGDLDTVLAYQDIGV